MKQFKSPTPRHNLERTNDVLIITIQSHRSYIVLLWMALWFVIWTYIFTAIASIWWYMFLGATGIADPKYQGSPLLVILLVAISIFLVAILLLGGFGLYRFLWDFFGKEIIELNKTNLTITRQLFNWKRIIVSFTRQVKNLTVLDTTQSLFSNPFQKRHTYAILLQHNGKTHRFGYVVKEQEATEIVSAIQAFISSTNEQL